ncbi:MAG: ATPase, T2SS/T4P/T4SS family [Firmicutes bacterium]|nr:ATPase, T2SS/T4P/T4SS family [Bacillota bacterium]
MALTPDLQPMADRLEAWVIAKAKWKTERASRKGMYTYLLTRCAQGETFVPPLSREAVITHLLNKWYDYDVLQSAIDDALTSDIQVIGDETTILRRNGVNFASTEAKFASDQALEAFVERQLQGTPYTFSLSDPITDAILPDGYRMNVIGGPSTRYTVVDEAGQIVTKPCTIVTIRKPIYPFTLDDLVTLGTMNAQMRQYFSLMQRLGDSFLIAGGVGSAKTTLMNALTGDIPDGYKNLFIEELPEMTPLCRWAIRLTDRTHNAEGRGMITMMRNLVNSFRMDAENEFIGEVRTPEIAHLFLRMSLSVKRQTGTTFHAHIGFDHAIEGILQRFLLEASAGAGAHTSVLHTASLMADKIRHLIAMREVRVQGQRFLRVTAIGEIIGFDATRRALQWVPVVAYDFETQDFVFYGVSPTMAKRAHLDGHVCDLPTTDRVCEWIVQ